ncbi:MAG: hypothetical protein GY816_01130 [Cytophagales bacterium]|nr:hypothetical protein [Cytophagales bacterium]
MTERTSPPIWYWIVSIVALLWNSMGVSEYLRQAYMTAEELAKLPADVQEMYPDVPAWVTATFAIAVFGGTIGAILLLLRKRLAVVIFGLSLLGVIVQWTYLLFVAKIEGLTDGGQIVMPILIPLFSVLFVWFAKTAKDKGWIS